MKILINILILGVATTAVADTMNHDAHEMAPTTFSKVMIDKLEAGDNDTQRWDAQAWYGSDIDKLWLKTEGERNDGITEDAEVQLLYSRAISPFFDAQVGLRHDSRPGPARDWLALGIEGLMPYFLETEATLFVGTEGRSALRLNAEYDLLLTQRLILTPEAELNIYGKSDAERALGSGLSDVEFGLRLRYEIAREFAPYIGAVWTHRYGDTADFARTDGGDVSERMWVIGLRAWF